MPIRFTIKQILSRPSIIPTRKLVGPLPPQTFVPVVDGTIRFSCRQILTAETHECLLSVVYPLANFRKDTSDSEVRVASVQRY